MSLMQVADRQLLLEQRVRAVEQSASASSRNSSSPPSADVPKTRQQRRAGAREKAKELARRDGKKKREADGQAGHPGRGAWAAL